MKKGQAAVITQKWNAQELEASARGESNARVCRRLLALRQLALGHSIEQASQVSLVSVSQIYNWIRRYEEQGIEGMRDRPRCGAPQRLKPEWEAAFVQRVVQGPGADSGLSAWRGEDLRVVLSQEFDARYSLSGVYALLHRLKLSNLVPRPQHPDSDAAAQAAFKKSTGRAARTSSGQTP
jgi:transposase